MRRFWRQYKSVIIAFVGWRILLELVTWVSPYLFPPRAAFLSAMPWANMDGGHYLYIAGSGYGLFEQAFFPFYPLLIRGLSIFPVSHVYAGLIISHTTFFAGLLLFYDLAARLDRKNALWAVLFLLSFPTSFFFAAVYSTSLFFLLSVATLLAVERREWLFAGLSGFLASFTRIYGVFLVIPALVKRMKVKAPGKWKDIAFISFIPGGLLVYMVYLQVVYGDALKFIHVLPAYGSQRSASQIILLPQVFWRYAKIFVTASPTTVEYGVAALEAVVFIFFLYLLVRALSTHMHVSYIFYCAIVLIMPTLTGTLTSIPRYVLDAFPLFIIMGMAHNTWVKVIMLGVMLAALVICTSLFLRGYFVA